MINQPLLELEFVYKLDACVPFRKISEPFGDLSNMASGFPLAVSGIVIPTSEALYQSCRFTHLQEIQKLIIEQRSPWYAKRKSRIYLKESRADWDLVRVEIMEWVQRVKLLQHWDSFSALLLSTSDRPIVEEAVKDRFWGATRSGNDVLIGANVLGRILTKLRTELKRGELEPFFVVEPPPVSNFNLYGSPIRTITKEDFVTV